MSDSAASEQAARAHAASAGAHPPAVPAADARQPADATPSGYGVPAQAYAPPPGYAAPPQGYGPYVPQPSSPAGRVGSGLGTIAFVLAMLAAVGATVIGALAGHSIGWGTGSDLAMQSMDVDFDWSILAPVRGWVLLGEIAFWAGTILGVWALAQGIFATVSDRGRGWGIAAIVVALIGPIAFAAGVLGFLLAGLAAGASVGG